MSYFSPPGTRLVAVAALASLALSVTTAGGQQPAASSNRLAVPPAEFVRLGNEVRTALVASKEPVTLERFGRFVQLQVRGGDFDGAVESAHVDESWYSFALIAVARYKAGDLPGAIA